MLRPFLQWFAIEPNYDLHVMRPDQNLRDLTRAVLGKVGQVLEAEKPDIVLVQGDTTTVLATSLAAYYLQLKVGHVEAGLRTHNKYSPFPEEINRVVADALADYWFAPTGVAKGNLLREGHDESRIFITGNTVVDALLYTVGLLAPDKPPEHLSRFFGGERQVAPRAGRRLILVTVHRRESFGEGLRRICAAVKTIAERNQDVEIVYPLHLNPNVAGPVRQMLGNVPRIYLTQPLDYISFIWMMRRAYVILTDSGGVQEEAPSLHKPVLVLRETTERPEGIQVGVARLAGTTCDAIVAATQRLLDYPTEYQSMAEQPNPYGDGRAADRIAQILAELQL